MTSTDRSARFRTVNTATGSDLHLGYVVDERLDPYTACGSRARRVIEDTTDGVTCARCRKAEGLG